MWKCEHCNRENQYLDAQCGGCGAIRPQSETPVKHCTRCGRRFPERYGFCGACGIALQPLPQGAAPAAPGIPAAAPIQKIGPSTARMVGSYIVSLLVPLAGFVGGMMQLRQGNYLSGIVMMALGCVGCVGWYLILGDYMDLNRYPYHIGL